MVDCVYPPQAPYFFYKQSAGLLNGLHLRPLATFVHQLQATMKYPWDPIKPNGVFNPEDVASSPGKYVFSSQQYQRSSCLCKGGMCKEEARQHYKRRAKQLQGICASSDHLAAAMDSETGLPQCLVDIYSHIHREVEHHGLLPPLEKLEAVDVMRYTDVQQLSPHVDHQCFPQGGVLALYWRSREDVPPLRAIGFHGEKGGEEVNFSCVCTVGSIYWMGHRLFAREGSGRAILHYPTTLTKGDCCMVLFRVGL